MIRTSTVHTLHSRFDRNSIQIASNDGADIRALTTILGKFDTDLFPVEICPAGFRNDNQAGACVECDAGSFSDAGGLSECEPCAEGRVSPKAASAVSLMHVGVMYSV